MHQLKEVVIEITERCNLSCIHCGSDCVFQKANNELSTLEWKSALDQLAAMHVEKVVFSGGEPTLKKDFAEILVYASQIGLKVGFISNGLGRFNQTLQDAIQEAKPFAVGLSIDGLPETHNAIRRNKGSWQGLMRNISILQKLGVQICIVTTLHKMNYHELPRLAKFLSMGEIDSWQLQLATPSGRMKQQGGNLITENDFKAICLMIMSFRKEYPDMNIQAADCFGIAPEETVRSEFWSGCTAGLSSMGIDAKGNIMGCLSMQESERCENLRDRPLAEIWKTSRGFDFNRAFCADDVEGACKGCSFLKQCKGGCNSQSQAYFGHLHDSPFCFTRSFTQEPKENSHE